MHPLNIAVILLTCSRRGSSVNGHKHCNCACFVAMPSFMCLKFAYFGVLRTTEQPTVTFLISNQLQPTVTSLLVALLSAAR